MARFSYKFDIVVAVRSRERGKAYTAWIDLLSPQLALCGHTDTDHYLSAFGGEAGLA